MYAIRTLTEVELHLEEINITVYGVHKITQYEFG
jgi:hypothetical protein